MNDAETVAHQTLTQKYLRKFNSCLERHSTQLIDLLEKSQTSNRVPGQDEHAESYASNQGPRKTPSHSVVTSFALTQNVWNLGTDPIQMRWGPFLEPCEYEELIGTVSLPPDANSDVQKVMLVLVTVTSQIKELSELGWSAFVQQILLYGDGFEAEVVSANSPSNSVLEGEGHVSISKFLPTLYQLAEFVCNAQALLAHTMQQLEALFKDSKPHVVAITGLSFPTLLRELGNLLTVLVVLDETIGNQTSLLEHWTKYRRMITSVRADFGNFDVASENLQQLEKELESLDNMLFGGRLFKGVLNHVNSEVKHGRSKQRNLILAEKFTAQLALMESKVEKEFVEGQDELKPIGFTALFVFAATLLVPAFDVKRTFKKVWDVLKKIPAVPIGGFLWTPETFLNSFHLGTNNFFDAKMLSTQSALRVKFLENKVNSVPRDVASSYAVVSSWSIRLQETMYGKESSQLTREDLSTRCNLLLEGVKLAQGLHHNFHIILNLHVTLAKPMTKQLVSCLVQHLELLKMIQSSFHRFNVQICHSIVFILQTVIHIALSNVRQLKDVLCKSTAKDELKRDALAVISILEQSLRGPPSEKRLLLAQLTHDWSIARCFWDQDERKQIVEAALERIQCVVELQEKIEQVCNGSLLYWHRNILAFYFKSLYQGGELDSTKLPMIFLVLEDCVQLLATKSPHDTEKACRGFMQEIERYLNSNIVEKLCTDVEIDLRLQTHSHLQVEQVQAGETSPFRLGVRDNKGLLDTLSLQCNEKKLSLKYTTEYYLSKNFYNLASVALHDWQSYATMRVLAMEKYQLHVIQDHLPGHSLEQGLDILAIVRDLNKFVSEFSYNLNNQVFVQVTSPNKHLETVSIRHLANSMRTHGPGMANNIVNFTYQFLRVKIRSFSEHLFYEQIKSKLSKDIRMFKQGRYSQDTTIASNSFPYERAVKFQRGVRNLGTWGDGLSYLDKFRVLITHIGNALGFVRSVRSGGLHFLAAGCRFLPDLEDITDFNDYLKNLSTEESHFTARDEQLKNSTGNLNSSVKILTSSFSGGVDYFKLLVGAFQAACNQPANAHMKNFYVIIPALTLSYVDHMRACKERLAKKSKSSTMFTDDGFPMGVAYLLSVLGQDADFESLQWFSGVNQKLQDERRQAQRIIQQSKDDEKLQQANTLTAKRLQDILHEFQLLSYNLSSARIFFQSSSATAPPPPSTSSSVPTPSVVPSDSAGSSSVQTVESTPA